MSPVDLRLSSHISNILAPDVSTVKKIDRLDSMRRLLARSPEAASSIGSYAIPLAESLPEQRSPVVRKQLLPFLETHPSIPVFRFIRRIALTDADPKVRKAAEDARSKMRRELHVNLGYNQPRSRQHTAGLGA